MNCSDIQNEDSSLQRENSILVLERFEDNHREYQSESFWRYHDGSLFVFDHFSLSNEQEILVNCTEHETGCRWSIKFEDWVGVFEDGVHVSGWRRCLSSELPHQGRPCDHDDRSYWLLLFFYAAFMLFVIFGVQSRMEQ